LKIEDVVEDTEMKAKITTFRDQKRLEAKARAMDTIED
jgi:hypothetical protein